MKKLITLTLVLCFALALFSGFADAAEYDVSIQLSFPEESASGVKEVLAEIEEESGGRIKFEIYYSYSFVDTPDIIDALQTNQLNIADFMPNDFGIFPLNGKMMALPLLNFPNWEASCKIWTSMIYKNEDMMKEFTDNGMVFWGGYMCPGYQFYSSRDITDTSPDTFSGLTIMCDNAQMQTFINAHKGGAINAFPTDFLSNLQNGVAEGLVQHVNCAFVFGCFDYVKSAIFFGEGGFYNLNLAFAFSETFWDSLPEDLQEIFAAHAAELCQKGYLADLDMYENIAYPTLEEHAEITVLGADELVEWQEAMAPIVEDALTAIESDSPNAREVYAELQSTIAGYDAETFDIGTNNFGLDANWDQY